jgi:hypothetical protein
LKLNLRDQIQELVASQLKTWDLARENYNALSDVLVRPVRIGDHSIRLQFNPKRIISSSAKVDTKSLSERPCFLCTHNRPVEQVGINYLNKYLILLNPYPVFLPHFTVTSVSHQPQRIKENFGPMLSLAHDLSGYVIIYNGPNCGASAPDHFHFQAVSTSTMPVEKDYRERLFDHFEVSGHTHVYTLSPYSRKTFAVISNNQSEAESVFYSIYNILEENLPSADEPMMNILTWFTEGKWIILIFPRKQHRPSQYFENGNKQILLSPASIDMGGVLIIPRKDDYAKISKSDIEDILRQVCVDDTFMKMAMTRFKNEL